MARTVKVTGGMEPDVSVGKSQDGGDTSEYLELRLVDGGSTRRHTLLSVGESQAIRKALKRAERKALRRRDAAGL